jgi:hypothetical protein
MADLSALVGDALQALLALGGSTTRGALSATTEFFVHLRASQINSEVMSMKAIAVQNFGDEPELMEVPDPEPGPGEVLVAIDTASINPMDWKAAQGAFRAVMATEFPLVLGFDGSGRVEALGPGAGRFAVGDLVHGQFWDDTVGRTALTRCSILSGTRNKSPAPRSTSATAER